MHFFIYCKFFFQKYKFTYYLLLTHETVTYDDRDPPWINKNVKQLILEKNEMYKKYVNENKDPRIFDKVKCLQNELNLIIESYKQKYYSR